MTPIRHIWAMPIFVALSVLTSVAAAENAAQYAVTTQISGPGGGWDYAVVDEDTGQLYLAQQGVTRLDLTPGALIANLLHPGGVTHGVAVLGGGRIAVADSESKMIRIFEGSTGKVLSEISATAQAPVDGHHALDALVFEPQSGLLAAASGENHALLLADPALGRVTDTIALEGEPEFAATDGAGHIYVNVNTEGASVIADVDVGAKRVVRRIALANCTGATGLAYDSLDRLLISACPAGAVKFVEADSGREVASLETGKGADAVMFDGARRLAFVPAGRDGTLSVIAVRSASDISPIQTLATVVGARLGAVDGKTGKVYLPTADFGPPVPPSTHPTVIPGTFRILVISPE